MITAGDLPPPRPHFIPIAMTETPDDQRPAPNYGLAAAAGCGALACIVGVSVLLAALFALHWIGSDLPGEAPGVWNWVEGATTGAEPADAEEREERMLAAQERMAALAVWMFGVGVITTAITAIGTYFLIQQIKLTRDALKTAKRSNNIAIQNRETQLRAYLTATVRRDGNEAITIVLQNGGITPAISVYLKCVYEVRLDEPDGSRIMIHSSNIVMSDNIAPNRERDGTIHRFSDINGQCVEDVAITGKYLDVFGREHTYSARFFAFPHTHFVSLPTQA